ncbi:MULTISPECIES: NACHT domain-containing protein [Cyanophyceae]|uniref:HEAT repeat domain-containing protein n=1 Tax=Stenomitos frigidus AS-A4 TaxID=2933935 RepID=A0ABV0KP43_9CYAN|nr:HEAT repeat domain-containing protein [Phormidium sp. FACHB-592]
MVFESITGGLVKAALPKVASAIATAVKHKLNPTELEKALNVGLQKSGAFERRQKVNNAVFYRCTDKDADTFLAALLEHPEVQRELQKPLEQDGAPDVAMVVQVAKHIAVDRTLDIPYDTLEPWLKTFANAYFNAITAIRFQVAKSDYLEQLANWFDDVKFAGVAVPGQDVECAERLAQIFVMPDVEEDVGRRSRGAFKRSFFEAPGEPGEQGRQRELLQEQRLRAQLERSGRKFSARQLLNQHQKRVVLLGAPGSGKTTLMSFFAVTLAEQRGAERQGAIAPASDASTQGIDRHAEGTDYDEAQIVRLTQGTDCVRSQRQRDRTQMYPDAEGIDRDTQELQTDADALPLPILIRIRDWARTPAVTIPEYARQFAETTMSCKRLPKGFFEHWLNNGRALILLDGLDEVAEESKRYHLVQCIENFLGQYPQNRAIITSRPAGYKRDFFRTEEFPHYELQSFDDGKIEEFCDRWYTSRVPDKAEAQRRKESLQKALNQQDRIKLLARNPLLLTIIALIHRYQARLPRERYKLYDKAVETLLTAWDDNKELSNQTVLKYLQLDDLRRLMESLAYWIHTQGTTGDTEGGTLIDKDELIQKLTQEIKTLKQLQHYEAKAEAERFVKFIRDRTGLLNEQGQDCYAFVHKTFQEYLAAQDINYQADNEDDFEIVLTHIEQHLHAPHWREVLLLLIAQQSPKKAARAIRKVLTANSLYEQWLHRDLLFAGRCLAEDPKGLQATDTVLISKVLNGLIALELAESKQIGDKIRGEVLQILCSLKESVFEAEVLQRLKDRVDRIDHKRLQKYQADLGEVEVVVSNLMASLNSEDYLVRASAAKDLGSLGNASESIVQSLLALLNDENSFVCLSAANALRNLDYVTNPVINALLALLKDEDSFVFLRAANALSKMGIASDSLVQATLILLHDENSYIRLGAANTLVSLGHVSDNVVQVLLTLLNDEDSFIRLRAANSLGSLSNAPPTVIEALLLLLNDENSDVRFWAVCSLGKMGTTSDVIVQSLLESLNSEHYRVRYCAIEALGNLSIASEALTQKLLALLKSEHSRVRYSATKVLGNLGIASEPTVQALLPLLKDETLFVRSSAADAIGNIGRKVGWVTPTLVQWIGQHQDEECVGAGIDALWEIVEGEG